MKSLVLTASLLLIASTAVAQDDLPVATDLSDVSRPGSARPGFYLALDVGGTALGLDGAVEGRFTDLDIDLENTFNGGSLAVGYSFANDFALELELGGGEMATGNSDVDAGFGQITLAARAPLSPGARWSPYLEGHLGASGLVFTGDAIDDRAFAGVSTGLGGGVEVHIHRRWAVDFGYRFTLIDFQQETLESANGDREIDLEGTGTVHSWRLRGIFSF